MSGYTLIISSMCLTSNCLASVITFVFLDIILFGPLSVRPSLATLIAGAESELFSFSRRVDYFQHTPLFDHYKKG